MKDTVAAKRGEFIELAIVVLGISLGVSLLAGALLAYLDQQPNALLLIGLSVIVLCLIFWLRIALSRINRTLTLEAILTTHENEIRRIVPVPEYVFSERLQQYFAGLHAENEPLARGWTQLPPYAGDAIAPNYPIAPNSQAARLVREAVEYLVLSELSHYLIDYFSEERRTGRIEEFSRTSFPDILLSNEFLATFSRSRDARDAFRSEVADGEEEIEIWGSFSVGGGPMFERFALYLPKGVSINRVGDHSIEIKNWMFSLRWTVEFHPYGSSVPKDFAWLILGLNTWCFECRQVLVTFQTRFSPAAILTRVGREHYQWADAFLARMEETVSFDRYLNDIGWRSAHTSAIAMRNANRARPGFWSELPEEIQAQLREAMEED